MIHWLQGSELGRVALWLMAVSLASLAIAIVWAAVGALVGWVRRELGGLG